MKTVIPTFAALASAAAVIASTGGPSLVFNLPADAFPDESVFAANPGDVLVNIGDGGSASFDAPNSDPFDLSGGCVNVLDGGTFQSGSPANAWYMNAELRFEPGSNSIGGIYLRDGEGNSLTVNGGVFDKQPVPSFQNIVIGDADVGVSGGEFFLGFGCGGRADIDVSGGVFHEDVSFAATDVLISGGDFRALTTLTTDLSLRVPYDIDVTGGLFREVEVSRDVRNPDGVEFFGGQILNRLQMGSTDVVIHDVQFGGGGPAEPATVSVGTNAELSVEGGVFQFNPLVTAGLAVHQNARATISGGTHTFLASGDRLPIWILDDGELEVRSGQFSFAPITPGGFHVSLDGDSSDTPTLFVRGGDINGGAAVFTSIEYGVVDIHGTSFTFNGFDEQIAPGETREFTLQGTYLVTLPDGNQFRLYAGAMIGNAVVRLTRVCDANLNGDSTTDAGDLSLLLNSFGTAGPEGDVNGDMIVDASDLSLLLNEFGVDCP